MVSGIVLLSAYLLAMTSGALRVKKTSLGRSRPQGQEVVSLLLAGEHEKEVATLFQSGFQPWTRADEVASSYTFDYFCIKEHKEFKRGSAILDVSPRPGFHSVTIHLNCSVIDVGDFANITHVPLMDAEIQNPLVYDEFPRTFVQREEWFRSNGDPNNLFKQSAEALVARELAPWSTGEWKCDSMKVVARGFGLKQFSKGPAPNVEFRWFHFPSDPSPLPSSRNRARRSTF